MGLFGGSTKSTTTTEYGKWDPYEYWQKYFGPQYGAAADELMRGIRESQRPTTSPTYQLGRQILDESYRADRARTVASLSGRGTAFSGQARKAMLDVESSRNDALANLIQRSRMQGPTLAAQLGGLTTSAIREPILRPIKETTRTKGGGGGGAGGAIGSAIGMGLGALLAAPTGGMSIPIGAMLGGMGGGAVGGVTDAAMGGGGPMATGGEGGGQFDPRFLQWLLQYLSQPGMSNGMSVGRPDL